MTSFAGRPGTAYHTPRLIQVLSRRAVPPLWTATGRISGEKISVHTGEFWAGGFRGLATTATMAAGRLVAHAAVCGLLAAPLPRLPRYRFGYLFAECRGGRLPRPARLGCRAGGEQQRLAHRPASGRGVAGDLAVTTAGASVSRQRQAGLWAGRGRAGLPGRAGLRPGGAEGVAQRPQRRADQHDVLEQELAGQHRQHRESVGGRRGDPRRGEQEAQRASVLIARPPLRAVMKRPGRSASESRASGVLEPG